jgi:hypothetical protein
MSLPEIFTGRLLSHNTEKGFFILSDGKQRFFCDARLFSVALQPDDLVSFTTKPPNPGTKFPRVDKIVFSPTEA